MERLWSKPFILMTVGTLFLFNAFYMLYPTLPLFIKQIGGNEAQIGLSMGVFMLTRRDHARLGFSIHELLVLVRGQRSVSRVFYVGVHFLCETFVEDKTATHFNCWVKEQDRTN